MSSPRQPGRPLADTAVDLRARLLDAAIACYARHGIAGTSNRAIAREAGANAALVNYYFGDREQLKQAVVEERLLPAIEGMLARIGPPPDDAIELALRFVDAAAAIDERHPWLPPLWVREVLCEGGALRETVFARIGAVPRLFAARFAQAQAEGRLNPELDPRLLMVTLVGLTLFPAASAPIWRSVFDGDAARGIDAAAIRRHARALLTHGLATPPGDAR